MRCNRARGVKGRDWRVAIQGVHMLMGSDLGAAWKSGDQCESKVVFIGHAMPRAMRPTL